jgi:hypothetical protein
MSRWKPVVAILAVAFATSGCLTVVRSSVGTNGVQGDAQSVLADGDPISDSGRYVLFESTATNLVPGDTNGVQDVFRHDNAANTTVRVSVGDGEEEVPPAGSVFSTEGEDLSGDGQYAVFSTPAALEPADTNGAVDVYVRSIATGTTERVSIRPDGSPVFGATPFESVASASISDDGRIVTVHRSAPDIGEVFVRDRVTHTTTLVAQLARAALLTGDGQRVVEHHLCTGGPCEDRTSIISLTGGPRVEVDTKCGFVPYDVSDDGRFIVGRRFGVYPTFTCPEPTGLVRWDATNASFRKVPLAAWDFISQFPDPDVSISDSGRFVAALDPDFFVRVADMVTGVTQLGDTDHWGQVGPGRTSAVSLSGSGRYLAFVTLSAITPDDDNHVDDVFTRYSVRPTVTSVIGPWITRGASHSRVLVGGDELLPGATVAISGEGITIHSVTVETPERIALDVSVAPDAPLGKRNVVVSNAGGFGHADAYCNGCLEVTL